MRWYYRRRRKTTVTKHYLQHKEAARIVIHERLNYFNTHYEFVYNRVAVRNQRRCWGSCSSLKNLNFSYRLLFLPAELRDYVIVHELCHLAEMNHGPKFWELVSQTIPDHQDRIQHLRKIERGESIII